MTPRITLVSLLLLVGGCFSTHLTQEQHTEALAQLVRSAQRPLPLEVHDQQKDSSRGYQFLLGIIPLTRIFTDEVEASVIAKLQYHAGKNGLGLIANSTPPPGTPRLHVSIINTNINGYDLIVVRRPSAEITLRGTLHTASGGEYTCQESGSNSTLSRFAFSTDLTQALEAAADIAASKLIRCLGLGSEQTLRSDISAPIDNTHGVL